MQLEIGEFKKHLVLAGKGNSLSRYIVGGADIGKVFAKFERVPYIGAIDCFEIYTRNPKTGESGWDIKYVEGVREKIEQYYPHFDCFITQGYPCDGSEPEKFYNTYATDDDYRFGGEL